MPGLEQAIREPWRMALAHAIDAGRESGRFMERISPSAVRVARQLVATRFNSPPTSSVGRLFDAVAALAGVRQKVDFEGQAAMELEWHADASETVGSYPFEMSSTAEPAPVVIDTRPLIAAVCDDVEHGDPPEVIARRFHTTLVQIVVEVCEQLRASTQVEAVALSGGVFMNVLLMEEVISRLTDQGLRVYRHHRVPPNDGGLSLGQLAIAAAVQSCDDSGKLS
jgi:hydrogenase maturation protein HypF